MTETDTLRQQNQYDNVKVRIETFSRYPQLVTILNTTSHTISGRCSILTESHNIQYKIWKGDVQNLRFSFPAKNEWWKSVLQLKSYEPTIFVTYNTVYFSDKIDFIILKINMSVYYFWGKNVAKMIDILNWCIFLGVFNLG